MGLLKVGIIGCGNFGGQLASAAINEEFPAVAFNASKRDLDTLDERVATFIVGDNKGTGKSRDYGKEFLLNHIGVVQDTQVKEFIDKNDVVIIAGAAGGGFGSATVPILTEVLMEIYGNTKLFIVFTTFPDLDESYTAQNHTEEFMRELLSMNVPYVIYDNDNYKNMPPAQMNQAILKAAVNDMKVIRGDYIMETTSGGIDERDLMTALSTPGHMVIGYVDNVDEATIENAGVVQTIKDSIDKSAHVKMIDDKIIMASAMMYNLSKDCIKYTPSIKHDIQSIFGEHITDYRNEAVNTSDDVNDFIAIIIAGLTCPTTRIDKVIARRLQIEKDIKERQAASTKLNNVETGGLKLVSKQFGGTKPETDKPIDTKDILQKFAASKLNKK